MKILLLIERCFCHDNSGSNFTTSCIICYHTTQIVSIIHIIQFFLPICLQIMKQNNLFTLKKFPIMTSGCPTFRNRNSPMDDGEQIPQWAAQWLRQLEDGLSQQMPKFNSELVHLISVVDKVAMRQGFLQVLRSSPVSLPPAVHTHPFITYDIQSYQVSVIKQHTASYSVPTDGI